MIILPVLQGLLYGFEGLSVNDCRNSVLFPDGVPGISANILFIPKNGS